MNLGDLNKVWEVKPLKKIGEDEARNILEKIAKQVQPIMRKRQWRVKLLSEFCPSNPSLLGLNVGGGVEVKLRLRRPNRDWDFLPYDQVLDTMLHELCHNEIAPHNADFYKLWDQIRKECEELISKGITGTGEGFDLPGRRLGGFSRQPPVSSLRQTALAAAENRARKESLMPSGPKRLGGDSFIKEALSPMQAAAMAAERRFQDEIWCGSHYYDGPKEGASSSGSATAVHSDKGRESSIIDLTSDDPVSSAHKSNMWECGTCTLLNPPLAPICEACTTERPKDSVTKYKCWSCKFCTLQNSVKLDKCSACGQWRYSYGAPVSASSPYLGT
uniref:Uncharacterized protein n=1 Tax=Kalanchoe fedtschenkoi TaxID=63787 RepID=A0A7N0SVS8_KALFE